MSRIAVESSALEAVNYYRGCLEINFESGHLYRYFGVPKEVFDELLAAPSKGRYFHEHILDRYPFERVD
jgi:hypothetical protein